MFRIIKWIYRMGFRHALLSIKADEAEGKYISREYINGRIAGLDNYINSYGARDNHDL